MSALTREVIEETVQKSGATSVTGLWKALGHASKISGKDSQKIRSIVPNIDEALAVNKMKVAGDPTASKPVVTEAKKEANAGAGANPYRDGSMRNVIFAEGSKKFWVFKELIAHLAEVTKQSKTKVTYQYRSVAYPEQNQKQTTQVFEGEGYKNRKVRLVAITK